MKRTRVIGVIPARWGSTRFPGKSLAVIAGRPLIAWVIRTAMRSECLDDLIVAADDSRIIEAAESAGARAVMTRSDHASGTDRVAEVSAGEDAGVILNIQGDEPVLDSRLIGRLAGTLLDDPGWDMVTAAYPLLNECDREDPAVVKVVCDARDRALYFSRYPIPYIRDPGDRVSGALHRRHQGIYAYRRSFLERVTSEAPCPLEMAEKLEQLRALHIGGRIKVIESSCAGIGVDVPADVVRAERVLRELEM